MHSILIPIWSGEIYRNEEAIQMTLAPFLYTQYCNFPRRLIPLKHPLQYLPLCAQVIQASNLATQKDKKFLSLFLSPREKTDNSERERGTG